MPNLRNKTKAFSNLLSTQRIILPKVDCLSLLNQLGLLIYF